MSIINLGRADLLSLKIRGSFQKALEQKNKVATGDTLRSVQVKMRISANFIEFQVYAGVGFKYIEWGKRANTKMPVEKIGNKFFLVKPLAKWKKALSITIPDFVLARAIARNPWRGFP